MRDPCTIPECVSQDSLRRFRLFKWGFLGLMTLLLAMLWPRYGWHANEGVVQAIPDMPAVALKTLQFDKLMPVEAGDGVMGAISLAGSGRPGSMVELLQDGVTFGDTTIDEAGNWSFRDLIRLLPGQHRFQARIVGLSQTAMSQSNLIRVVIPKVDASAQASGQVKATEAEVVERNTSTTGVERERDVTRELVNPQLPSGRGVDDKPQVARTDRSTSETLRERTASEQVSVESSRDTASSADIKSDVTKDKEETTSTVHAAKATPSGVRDDKRETAGRHDGGQVSIDRERRKLDPDQGKGALAILGTNRDTTGNQLPGFFGRAKPNTTLEIVKGETVLGQIRVRADGTWRCRCKLPPGDHTLIIRELNKPEVASVPKVLTVSNLAPPMILPRVNVTRPTKPVSCPDTLPSGEIRGHLYVVGRCETLAYIARQLGTDLASLMLYNPQIPDANRIYVGQKLNIPATAACLAEDV